MLDPAIRQPEDDELTRPDRWRLADRARPERRDAGARPQPDAQRAFRRLLMDYKVDSGLPTRGLSGWVPPSIPGYEIESVLGRGGMGIVYKARQTKLNRIVALKMILAGEHAGHEASRALSCPRPRRSRNCAIPTSSRSTASATTTTGPISSSNTWKGAAWRKSSTARPGRPNGRPRLIETLARAIAEAHRRGIDPSRS